MMIEGQEPTGAVAIRPCRAEECEAVLTLWRRAGAIPSPTDTLEELLRLVRSEHGDGFLVAVQEGAIVGSVIGAWDGWRGNIYRLAVAPEARRRGLARRLVHRPSWPSARRARGVCPRSSNATRRTPSGSGTRSPRRATSAIRGCCAT